jgi:hypothetical protein
MAKSRSLHEDGRFQRFLGEIARFSAHPSFARHPPPPVAKKWLFIGPSAPVKQPFLAA